MRLEGIRVLVTRPRERSEPLCFLLEDEGAEVLALSLLELTPPDDERPLQAAAEQVSRYRWVLFASPTAVHAFHEALREAGTLERLRQVKVGAVGPGTARALRSAGLEVTAEAEETTGLGLFTAVRADLQPGDAVLLPSAQEGRRELNDALTELGAQVTRVAAYKSVPSPVTESVWSAVRDARPAAVLFASPRTVEAFLSVADSNETSAVMRDAKRVAIGPTTAKALAEQGFPADAVAASATPEGLVEATVEAVRGAR